MVCHNCQLKAVKAGRDRKGNQRYRCDKCKRRFAEQREKLLGNMYLPEDKALLVLQLLVEGNSIRSIERITGIEKKPICTSLRVAGERCEDLMKRKMRKVKVKELQLDEIWTYCRMKEKSKTRRKITSDRIGDAYCFTAFERDSKLLLTWHLGRRTEEDTYAFTEKIYDAVDGTTNIIQVTTDGWGSYPGALAVL